MAQLIKKGATSTVMTPMAMLNSRRILAPLVISSHATAGAMSAIVVILVRHAPPLSAPARTAFARVGSRLNRSHAHAHEIAKKAKSSSRQPPIAQ